MLKITDFLTNHENLVNLLSVATYGNYWPSVATYKSDAKAGLFDDCDCREDKWAKALMHGKGIVVYDNYEMDNELNDDEEPTKHYLTMDNVQKGLELMQGTIKAEEYEALIDSISHAATDITYSWQFCDVVNDSLMKLPKYDGLWRKVYTVRVTMKSGDTREPRVLMDNDGITPRMMEVDMQKAIEDHTKRILEAQETLIANIR